MISQRRGVLLVLGQAGALLATAAFGVIDLLSVYTSGSIGALAAFAQVGLSLAAAGVWLARYRHDSQLLPILGGAMAVGSGLWTFIMLLLTGTTTDEETSGSWGLSEAFGMMVILLVLGRRGRPPYALPAGGLILLALIGQPLRFGGDLSLATVFGMMQAFFGVGAAAVGVYLRYVSDTRQRALAEARTSQRAEFARDLHDFIAHHVTGIVVQAQGAKYIAEQDPKRTVVALEQIEHAGVEAMTAMRRMVAMLRDKSGDAPLAPLATIADIGPLVEGFTAAGGPPVKLDVQGDLDHLAVEVSTSAYRVVMEALTNVRQHAAGATQVDVHVHRTPDWLLVHVADNGSAQHHHRPGDRAGFGLVGLNERVQAVGGWLRSGPGIGHGWQVDARIPLAERK
jgi:signal transduction histidine kinase